MKRKSILLLVFASLFASGAFLGSCNDSSVGADSVEMRTMGAAHTWPEGQVWSSMYKTCVPACPPGYCTQLRTGPSGVYYECLPKGECTVDGCPPGYSMNSCGQCVNKKFPGGCLD